ncbi:MAG: spore cortex biosynthesis protein YabQ [Syntrophomonadales bacterium]|jgi:spore cortex biosynthesis protein YabQ
MWIQAWEFLLTVGIGLALAGIFHFHQNITKQFPLRGVWMWLFDLGVWLVVIPLVFASLLIINQGEVRFYVFLALITGGGLYIVYLKSRLNRPVGLAAFYAAKSVQAVLSVLSLPWRLIKSRAKNPVPPGDEQ